MHINLFVMLDSVLQKASTSVDPYFIDVWVPIHRDDPEATQKLVSNNFFFVTIVSNNFNSYICMNCLFYPC
jgi:hypothetical protein